MRGKYKAKILTPTVRFMRWSTVETHVIFVRGGQNRLSRKWSRLWRVLDMKLWIGDILGCLVDFGIFEVNDIIVIHDHSLSTVLKIKRKSYKVLNSILAILYIRFIVCIKVYLVQSDRNRFNWILKLQIKFLKDTGIFFCD